MRIVNFITKNVITVIWSYKDMKIIFDHSISDDSDDLASFSGEFAYIM